MQVEEYTVTADERARMTELLSRTPRFSERHPAVYPLAVRVHRAKRSLAWITSHSAWACLQRYDALPVRVIAHKSLLLRRLGESEMWMQHNKVTNLTLAAERVDG